MVEPILLCHVSTVTEGDVVVRQLHSFCTVRSYLPVSASHGQNGKEQRGTDSEYGQHACAGTEEGNGMVTMEH